MNDKIDVSQLTTRRDGPNKNDVSSCCRVYYCYYSLVIDDEDLHISDNNETVVRWPARGVAEERLFA